MKKFLVVLFVLCGVVLHAQKAAETYSLPELQAIFKHPNYNEKVLLSFQKTMIRLRARPQLHEEIPGEVISWYNMNGQFSWHRTYLVQKDSVKQVETLPSDEAFLKKLNSYVPEKSRFSYTLDLWSFAFVSKKLDKGFYLIKAVAKSFNSYPEIPNDDILTYDLEYKTKDFKQFKLVRLKDIHTDKWIDVADY